MKHKQSGYASCTLETGYVAILHKTAVLEIRGDTLILRNGGWVTMSTQKAINGALGELNLKHKYWVGRKKGEMNLHVLNEGDEKIIPFKDGKLMVKNAR